MADQRDKNVSRGLSGSVVAHTMKTGAAVLPMAVGAGIVGRNIYQQRNKFMNDIFAGTRTGTASETQDIVRNLVSGAGDTSYLQIGQRLKNLDTGSLTSNQVLTAWKEAAKAIPDVEQAQQLSTKFSAIGDPLGVKEAIQLQLQKMHGSIVGQRTASRFLGNIRAIQQDPHGRRNFGFTSLPGITRPPAETLAPNQLRPGLMTELQGLQKALGGATVGIQRFQGPQGIGGSTLRLEFAGGILGQEKMRLSVPEVLEENTGLIRTGRNQFAVGQFSVVENNRIASTLKYDEWMLRRAASFLPSRIQGVQGNQMGRVIREFQEEAGRPREFIPVNFGGGINPYSLQEELAGNLRYLVSPTGERLSNIDELLPMLREQELYPLSPNRVLKGGFTALNPAQMRAFPEVAELARRPGQLVREYTATPSVQSTLQTGAAGGLSRRYQFALGPKLQELGEQFRGPAGLAIYGTELPEGAAAMGGFGEGQLLVSERMRPLLETETVKNIRMGTVSEQLMASMEEVGGGYYRPKESVDMAVGAGNVLGFSPEGEAITAGRGTTRILGAQVTPEGEVNLGIRFSPETETFGKFFGDVKGVGQIVPEEEMRRVTAQTGMQGADYFIHMDELKKSSSLLHKQIFTALTEFNYQNMQSSAHVSNEVLARRQAFAADPAGEMNRVRQMIAAQGDVTTDVGIREMGRLAQELQLDPQQAGLTFGSLPYAKGEGYVQGLVKEGVLPSEWQPNIMRGQAVGVAHAFSGGPMSITGAGTARASIEPRLFDILEGGQFDPQTQQTIFRDIAERRAMTAPESVLARDELQQSLRTLAGETVEPPQGARVFEDITKLPAEALDPDSSQFITRRGGSYIGMGGLAGMNQLYVPGEENIRGMAEFRTASGRVIRGDLAGEYQGFIEDAIEAARAGDTEAFRARYADFADTVRRAHSATLTGEKAGLMRGPLLGSRFLRGVSRYGGEQTEDILRIGIGEEQFRRMMSDIVTDPTELEARLTKFRAGEEYGGYLTRHPFIGQYSLAPARFYNDTALAEDVMHIPQVKKNVVINGKNEKIAWSAAVGLAGDYDADIYGATLADPRHEATVRQAAKMGAPFMRNYEQHLIRSEHIRAASATATGSLTPAQQRAGDIAKMAITGRIGELSFEVNKARAALIDAGLGEKAAGPMHMLEWIEQNLISAKHLAATEPERMATTVDAAVESLRDSGRVGRLGSLFNEMAEGRALTEDIVADIDGREVRAAGINVDESTRILGEAMQRFQGYMGDITPLKQRMLATGRERVRSPQQILDYLDMLKHNPRFGAFAQGLEETTMRQTSRAVTENINRVARAGAGLMANSKPLLWGFGASLAVAGALSSPASNLEPDQPEILNANWNNSMGDNVRPDNIHPDSQQLGQPTQPSMSQGTAPISQSQGMAAFVNVRGKANQHFDIQNLGSYFRDSMGSGTRVNARISDDRSNLTAQSISDILSR